MLYYPRHSISEFGLINHVLVGFDSLYDLSYVHAMFSVDVDFVHVANFSL